MKIISALLCTVFCLFLNLPEGRAANICAAVSGNLVSNCGFETGDFTSWTLSGNDVPGEADNLYGVEGIDPVDSISPNSGLYQAWFADLVSNTITLSQTIATTPGQQYNISWFLAQDTDPSSGGPGYSNAVSASFDGFSLANLIAVPVQGYTEYFASVTVPDSSSVLSLSLGNDLGEFLLDDLSVVATPEPSSWILALGAALLGFSLPRFAQDREAL